MAKTGDSVPAVPPRPTITLPPRPSMEALFSGGFGVSPGPMTLVSNFLSPDNNCSFSQLLAGAMASPIAHASRPNGFLPDNYANNTGTEKGCGEAAEKDFGFRQSRPMSLAVARSPMFTIPTGLSPSGLLNSPGFFSPHSPFGMSHQQALAQVTAQAVLAQQSQMFLQADYQPHAVRSPAESMPCHPSLNPNEGSDLQVVPATSNPTTAGIESAEASQGNKKYQSPPLIVDKPADDGYNWRKYGQKQVKGSEYPRSYYKCTHLNCPVKKKVERSPEGQITEIIYKGQHNHEVPQQNKRAKDGSNSIGNQAIQAKSELHPQNSRGNSNMSGEIVHVQSVPVGLGCNKELSVQLHGSSDNEEACGTDGREKKDNHDEPPAKRRNTESTASELPMSQNTISEPKIIVQTRSEVDLLDDGYRWRKYGQKVVKGNPHPRSYYKCTSAGCNVRKHVERASTDPKAVITTYEGKHNHDVPVGRNSSHSSVHGNVLPSKAHMGVPEKHHLLKDVNIGKDDQRPVALRLKEEQFAL